MTGHNCGLVSLGCPITTGIVTNMVPWTVGSTSLNAAATSAGHGSRRHTYCFLHTRRAFWYSGESYVPACSCLQIVF